MGIFTTFKARKASLLINKGDNEGAMKLYAEAVNEGLTEMNSLLAYSVLLIRAGKFQEARELLVKIQKYPMTEDNRRQLMVNYASVAYKLGNLEKGIELLERMHQKGPSGMVYQTLGSLYVEAGDFEKSVAFNLEAFTVAVGINNGEGEAFHSGACGFFGFASAGSKYHSRNEYHRDERSKTLKSVLCVFHCLFSFGVVKFSALNFLLQGIAAMGRKSESLPAWGRIAL